MLVYAAAAITTFVISFGGINSRNNKSTIITMVNATAAAIVSN